MKPRRVSRARSVIAIVDQIRATHPELAAPVRWSELQQLLAREQIAVVRAPIKARAYIDGADGTFVITMRGGLDPRLHTRVLLHEYAHAKLHLTERGEVVRQLMPCLKGDPREDEANLFALLLWLGPSATPEHPDVAKLVASLDAPLFIRAAPTQLDLPLAEGSPTYRPPSKRFGHGSHNPDAGRDWAPRRRRGGGLPGSSIGRGVSHDALLFDWSRDGKPLRYFHLELGWIDVYDLLNVTRAGHRRIVTLECGDRRAQCRVFVISSTDRRRYLFAEGEKRDRSPKALDRQLARAERLAASDMSGQTRSVDGVWR